MGYRWTKSQIEAKTIVESRQVDMAFSNYTSVVNGGMDRDNLPASSVGAGSVNNEAIGRAELGTTNFHIPFADTFKTVIMEMVRLLITILEVTGFVDMCINKTRLMKVIHLIL